MSERPVNLAVSTGAPSMIDNFALGLTHFLLAVGLWRAMMRADLDRDPPTR